VFEGKITVSAASSEEPFHGAPESLACRITPAHEFRKGSFDHGEFEVIGIWKMLIDRWRRDSHTLSNPAQSELRRITGLREEFASRINDLFAQ
jgi:hypothetical protein